MEKRKITANAPKVDKSATAEINVPTNLKEAAEVWGEDVCMSHLLGSVTINVQSSIRRKLEGSKTTEPMEPEAIAKSLANYKPTKAPDRMDPIEKMAAQVDKLSPEQREALIKQLTAKAAK